MDRVVSQSMNLVFEGIFGADFTASNFGFRRGKSQHQAIRHVQGIVLEGYEWCASIDLKSFFDEIPHGLILKLLRRVISKNKGVLSNSMGETFASTQRRKLKIEPATFSGS